VNQIVEQKVRRETTVVQDPVPLYDTARFEHMMRIARVMANCSLIPESLYRIVDEDDRRKKIDLPFEAVVANCFLIVSYSDRLGYDPFLVAQCTSVVRGRLMFEGKLIAAALDSKLGVQLKYDFGTWDPEMEKCVVGQEGKGDAMAVCVSGALPGIGILEVHGSVGIWKTAGSNSPWRPGTFKRQLRYRGAREWARAHQPAIMLGVYTDDEMSDLVEDVRARRAAPLPTLAERLTLPAAGGEGFSRAHVEREIDHDQETGEVKEAATTVVVERTEANEARGASAAVASADRVVTTDGQVLKEKVSDGKPATDFTETISDQREHAKVEETQSAGQVEPETAGDNGSEQAAGAAADGDPAPPDGTDPSSYATEWRWRIRTAASGEALVARWNSATEKNRRNKMIEPELRDALKAEVLARANELKGGGG
jgi:hypothetical protein